MLKSILYLCFVCFISLYYIFISLYLFYFPTGKTYMEVQQTRAMDGLALLGNVGGYVGEFLGIALIQLPDLVYFLYNQFMKLKSGH